MNTEHTTQPKDQFVDRKTNEPTNIGEMLAPAIERFAEMAAKTDAFAARIKKELENSESPQCSIHNTNLPLDWEGTFSASWVAQEVLPRYTKCLVCESERKSVLVNERLTKCGVPDKVIHASLENYVRNTPEQEKAYGKVIKQISRRGGFLILRGTVGTGKSHLSVAAMRKSGGIFMTLSDLIGKLRQSYSDNSGIEPLVERLRETQCFVLDELSVDVKGTDVPNLLYRILAERYDKDRLTIITSNESLGDIMGILGDRLKDRIKENYEVATFDWESNRGRK